MPYHYLPEDQGRISIMTSGVVKIEFRIECQVRNLGVEEYIRRFKGTFAEGQLLVCSINWLPKEFSTAGPHILQITCFVGVLLHLGPIDAVLSFHILVYFLQVLGI